MKIDRQMVYEKCGCKCGYCGKDLKIKEMQVDHISPQWMAGCYPNKDINDFSNLMPTCRRCNHYKRGDTLEEFRRKMKTLHERVCSHYIGKVALDFGIVNITPFNGKFYFEQCTPQS